MNQHLKQAAPEQQIWCLTLPLAEERPLTGEERRALSQQYWRMVLLATLGFTATPIALFAWMTAMVMVNEHLALMILFAIAGPTATVACALLGFRRAKHARLARRDLRVGTVQRFAGAFDDGDGVYAEAITRALQEQKFPLTGQEETVEVYGGTGRMLRVNGTPYRGWELLLERGATAPAPAYAAIAAQWLEKVDETEDGTAILGGQRELVSTEIGELRREAFRAWWLPSRWPLLVSLWLATMVVVAWTHGKTAAGPLCWLLILILVSFRPIWRGIAFARQLSLAARIGGVGILQLPADAPPPASDGSETISADREEVVVEILMGTDIAWTVNGKPASWRRL